MALPGDRADGETAQKIGQGPNPGRGQAPVATPPTGGAGYATLPAPLQPLVGGAPLVDMDDDYDTYLKSLLDGKERKDIAQRLSAADVNAAQQYAEQQYAEQYKRKHDAMGPPSYVPKTLPPIGKGTGPATNAESAGGNMERDHGKGFQGLFHPAGARRAPAPISNKLMSFMDVPGKDAGTTLLNLIGGFSDLLGSSFKAHAGVDSPTRLQKEWAMKLESQRAANQIYAAMDAEIRKMPIDTANQIKIQQAMAQAKATGDIRTAFETLEPELRKIAQQAYSNVLQANQSTGNLLSAQQLALKALE